MYNTFVAYLLWLISGCGAAGFHRFYLNKVGSGLLFLFTGGVCMIGAITDFFRIPSMVREANLRIKYQRALNLIENNINPDSAEFRLLTAGRGAGKPSRKTIELQILSVAKQNSGSVTCSELALESGISVDQARKHLDTLTGKGIADMRVTKSGTIVYYFADFAPKGDAADFEDLT